MRKTLVLASSSYTLMTGRTYKSGPATIGKTLSGSEVITCSVSQERKQRYLANAGVMQV